MAQDTNRLTRHILLAMLLGIGLGACAQWLLESLALPSLNTFFHTWLSGGLFWVIGKVFVASLKLLVVPLVLVSLVCGAASLSAGSELGRVGLKTLILYLLTTALAISLAMLAAELFEPGAGVSLENRGPVQVNTPTSFANVLVGIFPSNPFTAMVEGNMLQVIVFALLLGTALRQAGTAGQRIQTQFNDWNEVVMVLVGLLMRFAPYGVFALLFNLFAEKGFATLQDLALYFMTVLLVLLAQMLLVYPSLLVFLARLNPLIFLKKMHQVHVFAFSTASSNATLPVTLQVVEKRLGVDNRIASFAIPLGATLNMDGTAIMQGVATVFIAQAYGVDLSMSAYLLVILTATLASVGTAGVPGVGLVTLSMVLQQVNLPVEGIALIMGVDRLLDMLRTAVNVTGDAAVACVVAASEGKLNPECYAQQTGVTESG